MIAFYAVSNLAILNAVNVKKQYYPDTQADLFVRFVNGTTVELVGAVTASNVFDHVYMINFPVIVPRSGIIGKLPILRVLAYGKKHQRFVDRYLDTIVQEKKYDVMLTLHMDSHAIYFANYFHRSNKKLRIEFFEDGTASYLRNRSFIALRPIRATLSLKAYMGKCLYEAPIRRRLRHCISDVLYIYAAELYDMKMGFQPRKLEMSDTGRHILLEAGSAVDRAHLIRYDKRPVYYIANPIMRGEPNYDFAYQILDCIIESIGADKLIIKTHSSASTSNKLEFAKQFEEVAYVDRGVFLLEGLLTQVEDLGEKVIIARATTTMLLPKLWMDQEPYIILTLRLFPYYGQYGDPGGDKYIEMLRSLYSDPARIMVPNTLGELKFMLSNLRRRIYGARYGLRTTDQADEMLSDAMPEWEEMAVTYRLEQTGTAGAAPAEPLKSQKKD